MDVEESVTQMKWPVQVLPLSAAPQTLLMDTVAELPEPSPEEAAQPPLATAVLDTGLDEDEVCGDGTGKLAKESSRRCWEAWEDERIASLVLLHGSKAWSTIAAELPTRTGKQCRER